MFEYRARLGMRALFPECSDKDIAEFEASRGTTLPSEYREFLLQWNGCDFQGMPAFPLLEFDDPSDVGGVERLYGLAPPEVIGNLHGEQHGYEFNERVPRHILAIGSNAFCERIAISLSGTDRGTVYLWRPGIPWEEEENVPTTEYLIPATRGFRAFFNFLHENPDPIYR